MKSVRVDEKLLEEYRKNHPELAKLSKQSLVGVMLRKALEA